MQAASLSGCAQMRGQPITRALPSRAKGTSGDIIAHRDDNMFESLDPVRRERTTAVAATTSGDIIGAPHLVHRLLLLDSNCV